MPDTRKLQTRDQERKLEYPWNKKEASFQDSRITIAQESFVHLPLGFVSAESKHFDTVRRSAMHF